MVEPYKAKLIQSLFDAAALKTGEPFTLKSKRQSPYFLKVDAVNDGSGLLALGEAYAEAILKRLKPEDFDLVVGIPEKAHVFGPPIAIGLAIKDVNKRYSSYRQVPKKYGDATTMAADTPQERKQKEYVLGSHVDANSRVVLVDDVLTAGDAKKSALEMLGSFADGIKVAAIAITADRQEINEFGDPALAAFEDENSIPVCYAITATDIFDYLKETGKLSTEDERLMLSYFRAWGTPDLRAKYDLVDKPLIDGRTIIPACDIPSIERFEDVVRETADMEKIGGYKVGFELGLRYGLPRVVEVAKKHASGKLVIYDHQKAGTDIGDIDIARKFAMANKEAGIDAVIFFPQAGPVTQTLFTGEALHAGLGVIIGGHMTHRGYVASDRGYLRDVAPEEIYRRAARHGITNFVVPGNKPELVARYKEAIESEGVNPTFYAPGFVAQGGQISEAGKAAGERFHAIVGRDIMNATDIRAKAEELTSQL